MASGMSAARVSRMGLPLSQVSATASISRFSSITSAMRWSAAARSATGVLPHASLAPCAASRASSMSSARERATSQNGLPVTGEMFSKYFSFFGFTNSPPM